MSVVDKAVVILAGLVDDLEQYVIALVGVHQVLAPDCCRVAATPTSTTADAHESRRPPGGATLTA